MALKLKILPQYKPNELRSLDVLQFAYDEVLFEKIIETERLHGKPVKLPVESHVASGAFDNSTFGPTTKTLYGDIIKELPVWRLKSIFLEGNLEDWKLNETWRNKAVRAFLMQMDDKMKVWLYWH
ncbi:hypothetical protein [Muricauda sp. MAR_2010_75]|uniref:hypothetical protein n=1 Tax=Allomuricauda sp. MAR_2010_75 TaxID=1250232 RepID=UPI0005605906|nr:hypothetical protein [Muricauda sp. MAR_2010_75]